MDKSELQLKRGITLPLLTYYGLGNILGAGIYVLVGKVAGFAGLYAPLSFLIASLAAVFTAFTYAELSARYPLSAGPAVYMQRGFNIPPLSFLAGILIMLAGCVSAATMFRGFVGYIQIFLSLPDELIIVTMVSILGTIAIWGITESARIAAVLTVIEVTGLFIIIFVAAPASIGVYDYLSSLPSLSDSLQIQGVFLGAFLAFYAFIGFEDMVNVAEEVQNPSRNMPIAILLALGIATVIYLIVIFVCLSVVSPLELSAADAPLGLVYERATGKEPVLISAIGLCAVTNGALIQIIMASRILYGLSRQKWLPSIFARINPITRTPLVSTLFVTVLIIVMAIWLPIVTLAKSTSFLILIVFTLVNMALLKIKLTEPHPANIIRIPLWVPVVGAVVSVSFVVFQFITEIRL
jgi:APA family basic amino acid/polyamine antiporter